jgi:hypothetical protein
LQIENSGKTDNFIAINNRAANKWWMQFRYENKQFINIQNGKAVDSTSNDDEGTEVKISNKNDSVQQKFDIVYLDKKAKAATSGFNEEFGLHINRPFYLRSRLPMRRVAECIGASYLRLKRWRNNTKAQQWYFDGVDKTIHNNNWKSHVLDIKSGQLRMAGQNSRWW